MAGRTSSRPGGAVDALILANHAALARAPRRAEPGPALRGPIEAEHPPLPRRQYLVDLADPSVRAFMTTPADPRGRTAYIDAYPASNLGVRATAAELEAGLRNAIGGGPMDWGPHVTFVNDDPNNPSPRQPLRASTAGAIAAAIVDSGLDSVNINSTTGGHATNPGSAHNSGNAVDMNRVNGLPVGFQRPNGTHFRNTDPRAMAATAALQGALLRQPDIYEDYGPDYLLRMPGHQPKTSTKLVDMHQNHVHGALNPRR